MNPKIADEKGFNVLLYVASALQEPRNLYKILKAIYSADKKHLEKYGRQLFPQDYQKLKFGNVGDVHIHCFEHGDDVDRWPSGRVLLLHCRHR